MVQALAGVELDHELHGTNPYGDSLAALLAQTRGVEVGKARPHYSNLGFQLLGHAVAAGAGLPFAELLDTRIAGPLGVSLPVPASPDALSPQAVTGRDRWGRWGPRPPRRSRCCSGASG